jgi:hypothetical protein
MKHLHSTGLLNRQRAVGLCVCYDSLLPMIEQSAIGTTCFDGMNSDYNQQSIGLHPWITAPWQITSIFLPLLVADHSRRFELGKRYELGFSSRLFLYLHITNHRNAAMSRLEEILLGPVAGSHLAYLVYKAIRC